MNLSSHPRGGGRDQSGIALVLVLWMLTLLTVIANAQVFSSRTELLAAGNLTSLARAEALADAGIYMAIHQLSEASGTADPGRWKADGLTRPWRYGDADLRVTVIDESGKIDINAATPVLLIGLFVGVGVDRAAAEALADAVLDWRDADDLRRLHGAEKDDYAAKGLGYGPANADFETIDEIRQVLGMSDALFFRIEPFITVHSRQMGIDGSVASREVLLALPGATPEQVDQFVARRQALLRQGLPVPPFPPAQGFPASGAGAYGIQVDAILSDNVRFSRSAVVRLTGNPSDPVTILAWRAPLAGSSQAVPVSDIVDIHGQLR